MSKCRDFDCKNKLNRYFWIINLNKKLNVYVVM